MADRVAAANRLAALLRAESERYARLITAEMGKPIREARAEVEKCAWTADYYAAMAPRWLAPVAVETSALRSEIHYCPLGLVLGIMPWNFPFWQVFRFAVPTLMAGNGALVKHAPSVQGCAAAIEGCFEDAGFPAGLYANLPIAVGQVEQVVAHPAVQAVTLTGSGRAGRQVAALAGAHLKPTVLELGGSDPFVVLADADLDRAVATCLQSRLANAGQSCIGAKRIIVTRILFDDFRDRLADRLSRMVVGDPMAETSDIGPMAGTAHRDHLHQQVEASIRLGARCLTGGVVPEGPGAYYPPTLLVDVRPDMPAWREELFGPVFVLVSADDDAHAVRLANDSAYGLGATVFTGDMEKGYDLAARQLAAGSCFVNAMVRSDPRLPFGGIRQSGYGRELSAEGIRTFTNIKTVWVET